MCRPLRKRLQLCTSAIHPLTDTFLSLERLDKLDIIRLIIRIGHGCLCLSAPTSEKVQIFLWDTIRTIVSLRCDTQRGNSTTILTAEVRKQFALWQKQIEATHCDSLVLFLYPIMSTTHRPVQQSGWLVVSKSAEISYIKKSIHNVSSKKILLVNLEHN